MADPQYPASQLGASYSQEDLRARIIDPLFANDTSLDQRIDILEAFVAATPIDIRAASVPDSAKLHDRWYNISEQNQLYLCIGAYDISEVDKLSKWVAVRDNASASAATSAQESADSATQTSVQATVPDKGRIGWLWADTDESNRQYLCTSNYDPGDGPAPYSTLTEYREAQWAATDSSVASLLAAAAQGLQDGKIDRKLSTTVPDSSDGRDTWFNTDTNQSWTCISSYKSTDHDPYDAGTAYVIGDIVTSGGNIYQATAATTGNTPPNVTYWADLGAAYATKTLFRESRWQESFDQYARDLANAASSLADGKIDLFIIDDLSIDGYPSAADIKDQLVDEADNSQVYYCNDAYTASLPAGERASKWTKTSDSAAQAKAELVGNQIDQKSTTYFQSTMPTGAEEQYYGEIGRGDGWVDTDDENSTFVAQTSYKIAGTFLARTNANTDGAPYNAGTTYYLNDIVIDGGNWYKANKDSFSGQVPANPAYWDLQGTTTATSASEWQLEQWKPIADKSAQAIANNAQAAANGKSRTIVSSVLPSANSEGYVIDKGDIWLNDTNGQTYMSNRKQIPTGSIDPPDDGTGSGSISYWVEVQDLTTKAIADSARSAVDNKRTTFTTSGVGDDFWPGPGQAEQWPISIWDDVGGAAVGDLWYHTDTSTGNKYSRICDTAYDGYASGDIGSKARWRDLGSDQTVVDYVASQIAPVQAQADTNTADITTNANNIATNASGLSTHTTNADIHREINDVGTGATDLWSASKINTSLGTKANASDLTAHTGTANIHRILNDSGAGSTDLWSASKINSEITSAVGGIPAMPTPYNRWGFSYNGSAQTGMQINVLSAINDLGNLVHISGVVQALFNTGAGSAGLLVLHYDITGNASSVKVTGTGHNVEAYGTSYQLLLNDNNLTPDDGWNTLSFARGTWATLGTLEFRMGVTNLEFRQTNATAIYTYISNYYNVWAE